MDMECSYNNDGTLECHFRYYNSAYTLPSDCVGNHESGWVINAQIHEDYYEWVNYFNAHHPKFGNVWGDFQNTVYATSYTALGSFFDNFQPKEWDYGDI